MRCLHKIAAGDIDDRNVMRVENDGPESGKVSRALGRLGELAREIAEEERIGQPRS